MPATQHSLHSTVQYSTVHYSTVQYSTVQCSTVQCRTVQYSTVQYSTVQYSTVHYNREIGFGFVSCLLVHYNRENRRGVGVWEGSVCQRWGSEWWDVLRRCVLTFAFLLLCALVLNVFHRIRYYYCVCFDFVFCVFVTYFNIFYGFHRFECFCTETVAIYVFCFVVFVVYLHGL